jgi:uncharacterized membrane protein YuzA (DUF378 family)
LSHGCRIAAAPGFAAQPGLHMALIDFLTLVLILAAGFQVGIQAAFGVDAVAAVFGAGERILFILMGLSAVWQLFRQKFH